ncbi:MAG: alginate export family protein [Nitrospirae bacterium]|nr:alginate export family protein [Nitrospirota bacterium]
MKRRWIFSLLTASLVAGMVGTSYAEVKLSGGELRVRGIMVDNSDANMDGGFFEQRTRLNAEASANDNAKVMVQIQDSRTWGAETSTVSTGTENEALDVSQAYVDLLNLGNSPVSLRIGRQSMAYGEHRLIGSLEWSNNARRFDAIKGSVKIGDAADVDFWTAKLSEAGQDWGNDSNFNGIYAMLKMVPDNAIDVYILQKIIGTTETNFFTAGARVKGDIKNIGLDYAAEFAAQFGDANATDSMSANAYAARVGYTIPAAMNLRIGAEVDGATGEDTSTSDVEKFDNLYPTNHYLYGFTDDVNWTNMFAINGTVSIKPLDNLSLAIEYWKYSLAEKVAGNDDNGSEINGKANYTLSNNVNLEAAYALRDAGDFAVASYAGYGAIPANKSATFGYLMLNVKFM